MPQGPKAPTAAQAGPVMAMGHIDQHNGSGAGVKSGQGVTAGDAAAAAKDQRDL